MALRKPLRAVLPVVALAVAAAGLAFAVFSGGEDRSPVVPAADADGLMRRAVADLERGDVAAGRRRIAEVLLAQPNHPEALLYAGQLARDRGDREAALAAWRRIPDSAGRFAATARYLEGSLLVELQQARDAERLLRKAIELNSDYLAPHERLLRLYVAQMRADDIRAELAAIEKLRPLNLHELVLEIVADDGILPVEEGIQVAREFAEQDPQDVWSRLALALRLAEHRPAEAVAVLEKLIVAEPGNEQARASLARLYLDRGDDAVARRLFREHRPTDDSPAVAWLVVGRLQEAAGDWTAASEAYVEAVRRQPNDGNARYRLGQMLARLGRNDEATIQLDRAKRLDELKATAYLVSRSLREQRPPELLSLQLSKMGELLAQLGRTRDAELWYGYAVDIDPNNLAARAGYQQAREAVVVDYELTLPKTDRSEARGVAATAPAKTEGADPGTANHVSFRFVDQHDRANIEFTYFSGQTGKKYLVETVGGGIAVLDYDADGWPDLYFSQGSDLPHEPANHEHADRLFRNRGDGTFDDVTARAGLAEYNYSLGCSAADIDNDGDADLYVTNVGRDTLLLNNGDGTFSDATESAGINGEQMSSSAAFADLDTDGNLDLYVATYVESLKVCRAADGRVSACDPRNHEGPPDVLYHNNGDGTFTDVSGTSGVASAKNGKGLGIVVADLDEDGRPDIYVSNDTTPNFLFVNRTEPGGPLRFEERGLVSGAALNGNGEAEAGMGIAAADFDGDGRLDLHVTNFYLESNTLYRSLGGGLFEDATRHAGLTAATVPWLGFGTQAADFDLDGDPDLFVANGHIDDFQSRGEPWKMPAQVFRNGGDGRFAEVSVEAGPYFAERCLGRGVARLDWNRDGRPDLVVVNQDRPAALLTNDTPDAGRFARIQLHGVASNRDAIGARLVITAGGRTQTIFVCGGDGIVCSNERVQLVGLGSADSIDHLEVRWPSGETTVRTDLPTGRTIILVEGGAGDSRKKIVLTR